MTRLRNTQSTLGGPMESETSIPHQQEQLLPHQKPLHQQRSKFCSLARIPIFLMYVLPLIALGDLLLSSSPNDYAYELPVAPTVAPSKAPQPLPAPKRIPPPPTMRPTAQPTEAGTSSETSSGTSSGTDVENPELAAPRQKKKVRARRPKSGGPLPLNEEDKTSNYET